MPALSWIAGLHTTMRPGGCNPRRCLVRQEREQLRPGVGSLRSRELEPMHRGVRKLLTGCHCVRTPRAELHVGYRLAPHQDRHRPSSALTP